LQSIAIGQRMHSWKKDLDALVEQTTAFARAVTSAATPRKELEPRTVDPDQDQAEAIVPQDIPFRPADDKAPIGKTASNEREEIGRRLASSKLIKRNGQETDKSMPILCWIGSSFPKTIDIAAAVGPRRVTG
jgi:hypothetical protein